MGGMAVREDRSCLTRISDWTKFQQDRRSASSNGSSSTTRQSDCPSTASASSHCCLRRARRRALAMNATRAMARMRPRHRRFARRDGHPHRPVAIPYPGTAGRRIGGHVGFELKGAGERNAVRHACGDRARSASTVAPLNVGDQRGREAVSQCRRCLRIRGEEPR